MLLRATQTVQARIKAILWSPISKERILSQSQVNLLKNYKTKLEWEAMGSRCLPMANEKVDHNRNKFPGCDTKENWNLLIWT